MRQSKVELYAHLVWTTAERTWLLKPAIRRSVFRCLEDQAQQLGCTVLTIGGMPDHVHLVLRYPAKLSVAKLLQQLKGVSSHFAHDQLGLGSVFRWQEGYGVFSLSRSHVGWAVQYVERQEEHHAGGKLWPEWEETYEEVEQ
jgi:REP element-mobilizing transposase RayT